MIYIFQDESKIPADWLTNVASFKAHLDALATPADRKAYIETKKAAWGEIKDNLLEMSHGKCWYSEAPDAVSDWHVDHFRPKGRALDADKTVHDGYAWLAFDWKNYRISGSYPNSPHNDGEGKTRGKWDFFPLGNGSVRASWDNRNIDHELCLILDPTRKNDPKLMTFDEEGLPIPSDPNNALTKKKVEVTVHFLYLDSPRLVAARKRKWREVTDWIAEYQNACPEDYDACTAQDSARFERLLERLSDITGPASAYASTARACMRANGVDFLIPTPEETQLA